MLQNDYIMRQIEMLSMVLSNLIFGKNSAQYELPETEKFTGADTLYFVLDSLVEEGKINEAENRLFEEMDRTDLRYLELAVDFYDKLNRLDDEFLESHEYSREEIQEGLQDIADQFGVSL